MNIMNEALVIARGNMYGKDDIVKHLRALGLQAGDCVEVHSAMSKLGWVCGAEQAVVEALLEAVGQEGTLAMPSQAGANSDPSKWENPPVPEHWWPVIRDNMPAFDADKTPARNMGRVAELFRTWPGSMRSYHPMAAYTANGRLAQQIVQTHTLDNSLGEQSPTRTLYDLDARVLLLGVDYDRCTVMHLGEYRAGVRKRETQGAAVYQDGKRVWKQYQDYELDSESFIGAGRLLEERGLVTQGKIGDADAKLFSVRDAVDITAEYLRCHHGEASE